MKNSAFSPTRRQMMALAGATILYPRAGQTGTLASITGAAFGTSWHIAGSSRTDLERMRPDIETLFADIDRKMSPWRPDSTISRVNAAPAGWHAAEPDVANLSAQALTLAERSNGAFDPTVGPLVARWGFGPINHGAPGWRGLSVDASHIGKAEGDLTLDLCGIAKGWALDRAVDLLRIAELDDLLLDLGGELAAIGNHPSGRPWRVAVEHPNPGESGQPVLQVRDSSAIATSGLRAQSYRIGARTYGHIIDPVAHAPTDNALFSVTVVAPNAMLADGWATALFAAGEIAGPALAKANDIDALFLVRDRQSLRQIRTGAIGDVLT